MKLQTGLLKKTSTNEDFITFWADNNYIHQWMKNEYKRKKDQSPPVKFKLRLKKKHIKKLCDDITNRRLYHDTGYYWGTDYDYYNQHNLRDISILELALTYCNDGSRIYYTVI